MEPILEKKTFSYLLIKNIAGCVYKNPTTTLSVSVN